MNGERQILYYKSYFIDFFLSIDGGAQKKVAYVLDMLKTQERLSTNFVKFIRDGLFELRARHNGNIYRAFFIFDEGNIVMLFNGFQKKTQKTPSSEIDKKLYGAVGTPERDEFRKEAAAYCVGQIISDARKHEGMTQTELAQKIGTDKTYISRIEHGTVEPGAGLFLRIIDALGMKVEIVRQVV